MKPNWKQIIILIFIIAITAALRFYQLGSVPPGLIIDEASEGYNAFSILHTGKDRYGQSFPILFRSFGSFQAPLYTYLSVIPVYLWGNSIFSIHFISAVSGTVLVIVTFLLQPAVAAFLVAISPWALFFSRIGTEASLGVTLFALSFLMLYLALRRLKFFPIAAFILGLSTHAYYSERLISVFFLTGFILLFRKTLFLKRKLLILGLVLFVLTQIPHLLIANSGAFTRRFSQVDYFNNQFFQDNSGDLRFAFLGRPLFILREFLSQYLAYFSLKNLFFDPDPQGARSIPNLSAFYNWMIIPFIFGLKSLIVNRSLPINKMMILLIVLSPIPASLTRDPFSTIRALVFLWSVTIIIASGVNYLLNIFSALKLKVIILISITLLSLIHLYISYFVLLKYERSENYGYTSIQLLKITEQMQNKKFVIDSSRDLAIGIRFAFLKQYNPVAFQKVLSGQIKSQYYSNFDFDEPYILDNVEVRPISWKEDAYRDQIIVGDLLAVSDEQINEHLLQFIFDVKDLGGNIVLKAYTTDPRTNCKRAQNKGIDLKDCQKYL